MKAITVHRLPGNWTIDAIGAEVPLCTTSNENGYDVVSLYFHGEVSPADMADLTGFDEPGEVQFVDLPPEDQEALRGIVVIKRDAVDLVTALAELIALTNKLHVESKRPHQSIGGQLTLKAREALHRFNEGCSLADW